MPYLFEDDIKRFFVRAVKELINGKDSAIADMEILRFTATDATGHERELAGI